MGRFSELTDLSPDQARVAQEITRGRGSLKGPFTPMLHSPILADMLQKIGNHIRFVSDFPANLRELAILVVAKHWDAAFEWASHRPIAEQAGISPAACDALAANQTPGDLRPVEQLVYDFTRKLLQKRDVGDALFVALAADIGESGISELIGIIGYYSTLAFYLNADEYPAHAPVP